MSCLTDIVVSVMRVCREQRGLRTLRDGSGLREGRADLTAARLLTRAVKSRGEGLLTYYGEGSGRRT